MENTERTIEHGLGGTECQEWSVLTFQIVAGAGGFDGIQISGTNDGLN